MTCNLYFEYKNLSDFYFANFMNIKIFNYINGHDRLLITNFLMAILEILIVLKVFCQQVLLFLMTI